MERMGTEILNNYPHNQPFESLKPSGGFKYILILLLLNCPFVYESSVLMADENYHSKTEKSDSLQTPHQAFMYIRGLERDEQKGFSPVRPIWNAVSFVPRRISYMIRFASGYGAQLITDPKFIDRLDDLFFSDDRKFGWYPIVNIISGFRPRIGLNLFYRQKPFEVLARGKYADEEKYEVEARFSSRFRTGQTICRMTLSAFKEYDDDREFYSFGADPKNNNRSHFLLDAKNEYGIYYQRKWRAQFILGVRPSPNWEYFLTFFYQKRKVEDASEDDNSLGESFDLIKLTGLSHPIQQFHNEISVRFDTRGKNVYNSGGIKVEGHLSISNGIGMDKSKFLKTGIDFTGNIPIILRNRILKPRFVFDMIENFNDTVSIAFTEYPRHQSFRGVSERKILRIDKFSMVPSVEYQWPLSSNLGGHLFIDYLIVSKKLNKVTFAHAPWAIGCAIDFHVTDGELARIQLAGGSTGYHFSLNLGLNPLLGNNADGK